MNLLVTGATGLIGRALCRSLKAEGHNVVALSRRAGGAEGLSADEVYQWDPQSGAPPRESLGDIDGVVHLAGEPIAARRWSDEQKKRIRDSRILSTRHLVNGLADLDRKPAFFVSGSAVGFYGNRGDEPLDESAPPGSGFMSEVCKDWEAEADRAAASGIRLVKLRTGVVLSREGGALAKMLTPFKLGLGGPLGDGRQWFPWIHIDDIVGIILHSITSASLAGPVNGVAPRPVTNAEFTKQLARALRRPAFVPVPAFGLRALLGEMSAVLLDGQRVIPKAVVDDGYRFRFPSLAAALEDLFARRGAGA